MVIETYSDSTGTLIWQGTAMYASPDGTGWSNMPYTKEQKQWDKERKRDLLFAERIIDFVERRQRTLRYEYQRIKDGTSTLQKKVQQWFLEHYDEKHVGIGRGTTMLPDV
jgi:hypothetical protein